MFLAVLHLWLPKISDPVRVELLVFVWVYSSTSVSGGWGWFVVAMWKNQARKFTQHGIQTHLSIWTNTQFRGFAVVSYVVWRRSIFHLKIGSEGTARAFIFFNRNCSCCVYFFELVHNRPGVEQKSETERRFNEPCILIRFLVSGGVPRSFRFSGALCATLPTVLHLHHTKYDRNRAGRLVKHSEHHTRTRNGSGEWRPSSFTSDASTPLEY